MKRNGIVRIAVISAYFVFLLVSLLVGFQPGKEMGYNFAVFSADMLRPDILRLGDR